jgi:hypothetical protein
MGHGRMRGKALDFSAHHRFCQNTQGCWDPTVETRSSEAGVILNMKQPCIAKSRREPVGGGN